MAAAPAAWDPSLDDLVWLSAHVCGGTQAFLSLDEDAGSSATGPVDPCAPGLLARPLIAADGSKLGQLCVAGIESGALSAEQQAALQRLAALVVQRLQARREADAQTLLHAEHERKAQFLESLLQNTFAAVISSTPAGRISSFNPAAEQLLGYAAAEVVDRLDVNSLHLESELLSRSTQLPRRLDPRANLWSSIAGHAQSTDLALQEWQLKRKDGTHVPTMLTVAELRDSRQRVEGYVGIAWDITERRRLEQLKAEFISTVSHELRTPLTAISGALGLVCGGAVGPVSAQAQPMLDIAYKNSQRLTYLINDLLDMERLASGRMRFELQVQALMPLVDKAIEAAAGFARDSEVQLQLTGRVADARVRVDGERLQQVLVNFLSNAAKFSPRGAVVEVSVSAARGAVRVEVADQGPGIPEQFRERIFQKFTQADSSDTRQKGGTGLGLAICKELVERMNGLIGFSSIVGSGSRFHFELPLVQDAHEQPGITGQVLPGAPLVLVVEDDPDIAQLMVLMLNRAQIAAEVAGTAVAALECLQQGRYAAMTLDLLLPDQSGLALLRHIRDLPGLAALPVVVVSAYVEEGRLSLSRELTPIDWISKPIDETQLIRALQRALSSE